MNPGRFCDMVHPDHKAEALSKSASADALAPDEVSFVFVY